VVREVAGVAELKPKIMRECKDILVVDDEENIRLMLRSALESDGYAVREAGTGEEAIQSIEEKIPALVLLDLWMPQSNGMQVLEYLNQRAPAERPRVIVLTAHGRIPVVVKAMRLGASDFLEKPTTPDDLRISVAAALEEPAMKEVATEETETKPLKFSPALLRLRQAVWNQDIHTTERVLSGLFRKAWNDAAHFNLLGAVFEAEGNRGAARTFYQKACSAGANLEAAMVNLRRLDELEAGAEDIAEVELNGQDVFLAELCGNQVGGSVAGSMESNRVNKREPLLNEGSR
jgi:DNA-binding response OmpR family regulator